MRKLAIPTSDIGHKPGLLQGAQHVVAVAIANNAGGG